MKIEIDLPDGIYEFLPYSGTGKTYLYQLLKEYAIAGEPVVSYSYDDLLLGVQLSDLLKTPKKVLMLDRYDMYLNQFADDIEKFSKHGIVLIDSKSRTSLHVDYFCDIRLGYNHIRVEG